VCEHHQAIDLIIDRTRGGSACLGAFVLDINSGEMESYGAGATLLATGGIGQVYLHTTNPPIATATGSPWPTGPAPPSPTWSSCNSIPPRCTCRGPIRAAVPF